MSAASDSNFSSVSNTSFLYNLCDFHLNYAGCGRDVEKFLTFDIFMMALHSLTIATLSLALVQKFCVFKSRTCSANMPAWKLMDTVNIILLLNQFLRVGLFLNLRQSAVQVFNDQPQRASQIQFNVRISIYLEFLFIRTAALGYNLFAIAIVKAISAVDLFSPFSLRGKTVNPDILLRILRILVPVFNLSATTAWAYIGLEGHADDDGKQYFFMKRIPNLFISIVCLFISFPNLYFFGSKVLKHRKNADKYLYDKSSNSNNYIAAVTPNTTTTTTTTPIHNDQQRNFDVTKSSSAAAHSSPDSQPYSTRQVFINKFLTPTSCNPLYGNLRTSIHMVIWGVYFGTAVTVAVYVFANELIQSRPDLLFVIKVVLDLEQWFLNSYFAYYFAFARKSST